MEKISKIWDSADRIPLVAFLVVFLLSLVGLSWLNLLVGAVGFALYLYKAYNAAERLGF